MHWMGSLARGVALAACAAALGAARAQAQTVTGTVSSGGRPVVGATVRLLELDRVERTGAAGTFRFTHVPPGTYRIFAGVLGYASVTDTVQVTGPTATASFDLRESALPLAEIVVSASPAARTAAT